MENSLMTQGKATLKSYWNRPGGKIGTIIAGILGLGIFWKIWTNVIPKIIQLLDDTTEVAWGLTKATIAMSVTTLIVGGVIYAIMSPKFRVGIVYLWERVFINSWLSLLISTNPKQIAQGRIDDFEEERERFNSKVGDIQGRLADTEREVDKIDRDMINVDKKIKVETNKLGLGLLARERGLLEEWRKKLIPLRDSLKQVVEACNKIYENSGYQLKEMKLTFEYSVKMFESTTKAAGALKTAFGMFSGKSAEAKLGEEALLFMEQKISDNIGNMRNDMKNIDKFVSSIDLQNKVYEQDGMDIVKQINPEMYKKFNEEPIIVQLPLSSKKFEGLIKL